MGDERPELGLAGEQHLVRALAGDLIEDDGGARHGQARDRCPEQRLALDDGAQDEREAVGRRR